MAAGTTIWLYFTQGFGFIRPAVGEKNPTSMFSFLGSSPVTGLNIYSMVVVVIGAVMVLVVYHAVTARSRTIA